MTVSTSDFGSGTSLYVELGSGLDGYMKEVYITNHLEHSHVFKWFKNTFGVHRYYCFDTSFYDDPHYLTSGCGNGYIDAGEACDDGNNSNSDGCSSGCVVENSYMCSQWKGTAGSSL